jgi:PIN domain nuclease of toxin-antitoxin system
MMSAPLLLDTHVMVWIAWGQPLSPDAMAALANARDTSQAIYISPISAWEIGMLVARSRLNLQMSPARWFERALLAPNVRLAEMSTDTLISSSFLPGAPPRDPADRILTATARDQGFRLVTRDRLLLAYGEQGHVQVLSC